MYSNMGGHRSVDNLSRGPSHLPFFVRPSSSDKRTSIRIAKSLSGAHDEIISQVPSNILFKVLKGQLIGPLQSHLTTIVHLHTS